MSRKALVISGGGSRGAYAVGAIDHMVRRLGLRFDLVAGTSTGALIAPLVVTGEIDLLIQRYTSVDTDDILEPRGLGDALLRKSALYGTRPIAGILKRDLTEARTQRILQSGTQMFLVTVELQSGEVVYFQSGPPAVPDPETQIVQITSRDTLLRAVLASGSQPVFMPPIEIPQDGDPVRQYVDGGVREVAPLKIALDNGATELFVILLSPRTREVENKRFESLLGILADTIGLFGREVMKNDVRTVLRINEGLAYLGGLRQRVQDRFGLTDDETRDLFDVPNTPNPFGDKRPVTIHLIQPETKAEVPLSALDFDREEMRRMVERGRAKAREVLGDAPPVVA